MARELPEVPKLEERQIELLDGQTVTFIRETSRDRSLDVRRKRFWIRDAHARIIPLGMVSSATLPLYNIGAIRRVAEDERVVFCEGTPPVDALSERGILAVGTLTGALSAPSTEALAPLEGRRILLWPDNDDVGVGHMLKVSALLAESGGHVEGVVRWEGGPYRADAADFDGPDAALLDLIAEARPWDVDLLSAAEEGPKLTVPDSPLSLRSGVLLAFERNRWT